MAACPAKCHFGIKCIQWDVVKKRYVKVKCDRCEGRG